MRVDYKAIADAAPSADWETSWPLLRDASTTVDLEEVRITEAEFLSRLGVTAGDDLLTRIEANIPARVMRLIQSPTGINIADQETIDLLLGLKDAGIISQPEYDTMTGWAKSTRPTWPGLMPGDVQVALRKRAAGEI